MSAVDLTPAIMGHFRRASADSHTTLLLGAGASAGSGLPDWDEFAVRLLMDSGSVTDERLARVLLSRQDPMLAVEAARTSVGDGWDRLLKTSLYRGVTSADPSALHLASAGHYLDAGPEKSTLATLNFDNLLEKAIHSESGADALSRVNGEPTDGAMAVHHLHGLITSRTVQEVVLTLNDFTEVIANPQSWQAEFLRDSMARGSLIIAGTSFRDPDIRQWLRQALADKPPEHSALVLLAREAFGLGRGEFRHLEQALADQWSAVGMYPVLLQDHADAAQIIRELSVVSEDGYLAPQERCELLWKAHSEVFAAAQEEDATRLDSEARTMAEIFDAREMDVTVWITDGDGNLVRWAASDRVYRSQRALRRIPVGHDSPRIAGRALGESSLVLQNLEPEDALQWKSVLAVPLALSIAGHPSLTAAVLTIGLPERAERYLESSYLWSEPLAELAEGWAETLSDRASDMADDYESEQEAV